MRIPSCRFVLGDLLDRREACMPAHKSSLLRP